MKRIFILFILKISQFSRDPNFLKSSHTDSQTILSRKRHPHTIFSGMKERVIFYSRSSISFSTNLPSKPSSVRSLRYQLSSSILLPIDLPLTDSILARILDFPVSWGFSSRRCRIVDSKESSKLVKSYREERRKRERKGDLKNFYKTINCINQERDLLK